MEGEIPLKTAIRVGEKCGTHWGDIPQKMVHCLLVGVISWPPVIPNPTKTNEMYRLGVRNKTLSSQGVNNNLLLVLHDAGPSVWNLHGQSTVNQRHSPRYRQFD